ncbi:methyltransferase domain-containing protein [Irregularibacter muris]|uniref:Methyltransferase domain-containing protein n=1 Tax=Irregularibacter muris TaxID=1796619 RepID=A0AAE3L3D0_9FIRM|nr:class I SAM-dependent methyltransferase [Irregularibacter muris]MCR1898053.1 methyltransferase domain-containing protein [Irregularibacter muris]
MELLFENITSLAQYFIYQIISPGDYAIDGTAGNGNDTLFLANLVAEQGKVFSFDIQKQAIDKTKEKLMNSLLFQRVELLHCSHENISKYVNVKVKGAMFNLGYLPRGDHAITTKGDSTVMAIEQTLELLLPKGIITICVYHGHPEGKNEQKQVLSFVHQLDNQKYNVIKMDYYNKLNNPPQLIIIEKK